MLFNSLLFLFGFLLLAFLGYRACLRWGGRKPTMVWLVAVSLLFYGWWNPAYLLLLCGSILFNYIAGELILNSAGRPSAQKGVMAFAIAANLGTLVYYKYLFPLLAWARAHHLPVPDAADSVILPLGISFFTFTQIGYLFDCKDGLASGRRFLEYALFVTFFPHLIAGPILHHREMIPQFEDDATWRPNAVRALTGFAVFTLGLGKKVLIADGLSEVASLAFDHPDTLTTAESWYGALSYSLQLYFDFSGYSEMAAGLALLFNLRFPANFDSPYRAPSIIDFWQRWHMTLTRYLNLYLYNPMALAVTRWRTARGLPVGRRGLKTLAGFASMTALPTFYTLFLAGIWHGAGVQFIIFGLLHAFYLVVNHAWRLLRHDRAKAAPPPSAFSAAMSTAASVLLTYLAVVVAQVFFRAHSVDDGWTMLRQMGGLHASATGVGIVFPRRLLPLFLLVWFAPNVLQIFGNYEPMLTAPRHAAPALLRWRPNLVWGLALGGLLGLAVLLVNGSSEFLYFQF